MTIEVSNISELDFGDICRCAKMNENVGVVVGSNNEGGGVWTTFGYVVNVSPWSVGSQQILHSFGDGAGSLDDLTECRNDAAVLRDDGTGAGDNGHFHILTRSGNNLVLQTEYSTGADDYLPGVMAVRSAGDILFVATDGINLAGADKYVRFTISGNTVSFSAEQNPPNRHLDNKFTGLAWMDDNVAMVMSVYLDDILFQMVNLATGISQGSIDDSGYNFADSASELDFQIRSLVKLTDTKAVALAPFESGANDTLHLFTVNRSGTSISSYGPDLEISSSIRGGVLAPISSSKFLAAWHESSNDIKIERYSVSGDTITADGIVATMNRTNTIDDLRGLSILSNGEAILTWTENFAGFNKVMVGQVSGFGVPAEGRLWVYKTTDGGKTWTSRGVKTP